jgi:hypothetical protein
MRVLFISLLALLLVPVSAAAQTSPWDDLVDAVEQLRDASVAPPTIAQSSVRLNHVATADVWTGQTLGHGSWQQWYPAQSFSVVGTSVTVPTLICLNQSGRIRTGTVSSHGWLVLRLNVDGIQARQISSVVEAEAPGLYRTPGGGCHVFDLTTGSHAVTVEYNSYPFPPYDVTAYLRPMTLPDYEFLNLMATQLGS